MKEKKIQKLLSLILSVFMVFSVMTVPAFAAPTDNAAPEPSAAAEAADTDADKASEKTDKTDKETAAENNSDKDQKSDTISVEENFGTYKVDANDIDVSDVGTGVVLSDVESDKIDTDDPEIATIEEELKEITLSVGAEYNYNQQFFVRTGYFYENAMKGNRQYFSFGAGFSLNVVQLDAAYMIATAQNSPLDQTLRFSLTFDMDGLKHLLGKK